MAMTNPAMSPAATPKFCSQCGSSLAAGSKFCPACGASVGAGGAPPASAPAAPPPSAAAPAPPPPPPPPPPSSGPDASALPPAAAAPPGTPGSSAPNPYGAPPVAPSSPPGNDVRGRVDQDRGFLKKLQLMIPGFRGYRQAEDIRAADSILRIQVADRLVTAMGAVDTLRSQMTRDGVMAGLTTLGGVRSEMQRLEGQIRHAEGGYSGISATLKVTPENLDKLYERDWTFIASADQVLQTLGTLQQVVKGGDTQQINDTCDALRANVKAVGVSFSQRLMSVEGVLQ